MEPAPREEGESANYTKRKVDAGHVTSPPITRFTAFTDHLTMSQANFDT